MQNKKQLLNLYEIGYSNIDQIREFLSTKIALISLKLSFNLFKQPNSTFANDRILMTYEYNLSSTNIHKSFTI